ncbi:ABC transporter permease [Thiorhodococcus mannitoliphagus]|uniref:ABC transporter permease n=1 Tax=Thiorhodococcus mannitoliphagus TaxID=329406 RepID=A0A6P1DZ41_9GAMM|nr:ABC transporter permease [Thiorhodococcus mannitoliphagus]NEX22291.1 ABC transporter permease [Thiorhodococcus mannitoliphagus]
MSSALRHVFLASLWRRRLATTLSLLAIALGVALGLTVQLIHSAALDEFGRGIRLLNGAADLQALGPRDGFSDALYPMLARSPAVDQASPLLEIEARLPDRDETLKLIGIDLFRVGAVTPALLPMGEDPDERAPASGGQLDALRPDALFLSPAASAHLGLGPGDRLRVQVGTREQTLRIAGGVPGAGVGQRLAVMDIAAAQQTFERIGLITRVDLRLAPGVSRATAQAQLGDRLPPGVALLTPEDASSETLGLSRAYRVNLTMLAAIALLTGGFLVFSTQWLAVVRRRQEFAFLRAIGLDRAELRRGLLAEGGVLGLIGGLLGCLLAYLLTALAFALIGGDLGAGFFRGLAPQVQFEPILTLIYLALGVLAGLGGAWLPAREAARMVPARALRAGDEAEVYRARPRWRTALAALALAALCCLPPPIGGVPVFGYLAVALILTGAILSLPGTTAWAMPRLPAGRSTLWRLARARLTAAPGQTVVAGAGVVASVALAVSMAIMVDSFRGSVDDWLTRLLPADLYLRASDASASGYLDAEAVARVAALPGVAAVRPVRFETLRLREIGGETSGEAGHAMALIARQVRADGGLPLVAGTLQPPTGPSVPTPVWISEAAADRLRLGVGDAVTLPLGEQPHGFQVAGIWRDYARQQGSVVIEIADYRALTNDSRTNDLGLTLTPGTAPEPVMAAIRATLGEQQSEMILPGELRTMVLEVFDRTFLVTYLMEAVAILIGLFGIGTTFAALATSRRKELGILRHLGLRRRQVGTLLATEAALSALVGVAIGLLAGGAIALVLIEVVNRQSFRWSMDLQLPIGPLLIFSLAMILLAAIAARLSGAQAMRQDAVLAVREDW